MNRTSRPVRNEPGARAAGSRATGIALFGLVVGMAVGLLISIFTPTGPEPEGVNPTDDPENRVGESVLSQTGESARSDIPYDPSI